MSHLGFPLTRYRLLIGKQGKESRQNSVKIIEKIKKKAILPFCAAGAAKSNNLKGDQHYVRKHFR